MANFAPLKRHMFDCLDRFVEEQRLEPPFLDVGCGAGDVAEHLARRGWRGTAIDASPAAIGRARERLAPYPGVDVRLVRLEDLEGAWPTVLMWDVLEHLDDDRAALARRRAPDGARRPSPARGPQQPARVALGRRLLRPRPPLHGRRPARPARGSRARGGDVRRLHVPGLLGDAPRVHVAEARPAAAGRCARRDDGERHAERLGPVVRLADRRSQRGAVDAGEPPAAPVVPVGDRPRPRALRAGSEALRGVGSPP
ncbi:MAG: class I SAM-dependent methyltransferase [Betaproteobacteria bacterium]|nr:class I SAM-dependent methyltransferase [Betaproteobacteria bacterium]